MGFIMNIRKKMLMSLALAVFAQSAQISCAQEYSITESFLDRLIESVENAIFSRPGACVALACGVAAYSYWYNSQKQHAAQRIADAKAYLKKDNTIHSWEIKRYPTQGSIYRAFNNNEQALFQAIDKDIAPNQLCQCPEFYRNRSMQLKIDDELKEIGKHIGNLSDNDLARVHVWLRGFTLPDIAVRTEQDERELESYVTTHIAYRGLPSGRYFIEDYIPNTKKWLCAMVCNGSNWTVPLRPFRLAKSFVWPFEGEACQVLWDLIKRQERLQLIRKMLPNIPPSLDQAHRRTTAGCGAKYCLHFKRKDKNKKLDVNVHMQPHNHGL